MQGIAVYSQYPGRPYLIAAGFFQDTFYQRFFYRGQDKFIKLAPPVSNKEIFNVVDLINKRKIWFANLLCFRQRYHILSLYIIFGPFSMPKF